MAGGLPDFQFAQPVTSYQQGMQAGNALQAQQMQLQQAQQAQSDQGSLNALSSQAYANPNEDTDQRNSLLSQMAAISPDAAAKQAQAFSTMDQNKKDQVAAGLDQFAHTAASIAADPDPNRASQAYQQLISSWQQGGHDVSQFQNVSPQIGAKMALMQIASTKDLLTASGVGAAPSADFAKVDQLAKAAGYQPGTPQYQQYMQNALPQAQQAKAPDVQTINFPGGKTRQMTWDGSKFVPVQAGQGAPTQSVPGGLVGAVIGQESGGNPNAVSPAGARGTMQLMPATAANPGFGIQPAQDGSDAENRRVGTQYLSALMQKYGGNTQLALAAYNAGPGRVDGALSQAGGDPQKALSLLPAETQNYVPSVLARAGQGGDPGGTGVDVGMGGGSDGDDSSQIDYSQAGIGDAKAGAQSTIAKRNQDLTDLGRLGTQISPAQRQTYLTTGKFPEDADQPLSSTEESEAQALATYKLPVSPYMLSKPAMQPIIQRALQINPNFNNQQYGVNQKALSDYASNSPTSSGGIITAANTSLGHLADMADISKKLPSHIGLVNSAENAANQFFNSGTASDLKAWNTAKNFLSGEVAKMVKGGVASETETKQMLDSLDPNDPNRDVALATFAKFMKDKTDAMEQKRNDILGSASPNTSLLSKTSQGRAARLITLDPNNTAPTFSNPGSLSTTNQGQPSAANSAQQSPSGQPATAQPRAVNSMGHAVVWNGSAWVPE